MSEVWALTTCSPNHSTAPSMWVLNYIITDGYTLRARCCT